MDDTELKLMADSIITFVQDINADPTGMATSNVALGVVHSEEKKKKRCSAGAILSSV